MKVLLIATEFPPAKGYGLARYTYNLARALVQTGVSVQVLSLNNLEGKSDYAVDGIKVHLMTEFLPFKSFSWVSDTVLDNIRILERAIAIMEKEKFDIISIHDWLAALSAKALKTIYKIPLILTVHDTEVGKRNNKLSEEQCYIAEMEQFIAQHSPYIITNSNFMKQEIAKLYNYNRDKIFTIPCAVNFDDFTTNCNLDDFKSIYAPQEYQIVLFVGRLSPMKGPQILIQTVNKVIAELPQTIFVFVGNGVLEQELQQTAQKNKVANNVRFVGHLSGKVLAATYRVSDCLVIPSIYEPFGMVTLEGMICETPVIVSGIGGLGEIVENQHNGYKVPPENEDALAETIIKVLSSPEEVKETVQKAKHDVKKYSWQNVAKEIKIVYEKVIKENGTF